MSLRMLLSMLRRNALMPGLVMLQVMVACAILSNVLFMAWQRLEPMLAPSGVDADNLILVHGLSPRQTTWSAAQVRAGTVMLRNVPGVVSVSAAMGLPLMTGTVMPLALRGPTGARVRVGAYSGRDLVRTLGVRLVAGRQFIASDYPAARAVDDALTPIIITRSLADQLFPDGHALGQRLRIAGTSGDPWAFRVIGICAHLLRSRMDAVSNGRADNTVLLPVDVGPAPFVEYAVRVQPHARDATLRRVRAAVDGWFDPLVVAGTEPQVALYATLASAVFRSRVNALWLFGCIVFVVLTVTLLGVMSLTAFWVQQRIRQVGIVRALGARRAAVVRWFMLENLLMVGTAVACGMVFAYAGHLLLMRYYALQSLPLRYLPIGAFLLLILGQLAALVPALRAARVPPGLAARGAERGR